MKRFFYMLIGAIIFEFIREEYYVRFNGANASTIN